MADFNLNSKLSILDTKARGNVLARVYSEILSWKPPPTTKESAVPEHLGGKTGTAEGKAPTLWEGAP